MLKSFFAWVRRMLGIGVGTSPHIISSGVLSPGNTVAPVVSGSLPVGSTMTCTTGTWTNSPSGYHYQWYEAAIAVGSDQNTYVSATVGASIYCVVTAFITGKGSGAAPSNSVGPVTGAGLATPTLTNFSALGTGPLVLEWSTTDYVAGLRAQLQIDQTSSAFSNLTQNIIFFIDGASWALADESIALVTPSGTYWARIRVVRDNESGATTVTGNDPAGNALSFNADVSSFSTTFTDTISASVAVLTSTNGTSKNANIAVTGTPKLIFAGSGGVGAYCSVRATIEAQSDFTYWETQITQFGASDFLFMGFCNLTDSFVGFVGPGSSTSNGVIVKIKANQVLINWNSDVNGATLSSTTGVAAVSDYYGLLLKKSTNQLSVYRTRSGATTQIGTTQTIPSFAAYYAFISTKQDWNGTCNFGPTFARTLGTETFYG